MRRAARCADVGTAVAPVSLLLLLLVLLLLVVVLLLLLLPPTPRLLLLGEAYEAEPEAEPEARCGCKEEEEEEEEERAGVPPAPPLQVPRWRRALLRWRRPRFSVQVALSGSGNATSGPWRCGLTNCITR